jgi:hypothetical protein
MTTRIERPPQHRAQWWPEGAFVHVRANSPDERVAGKTCEVCTGRLVVCQSSRCKGNGCIGLGISVRVFDETAEVYEGCFFPDGAEAIYPLRRRQVKGKWEGAEERWTQGADRIIVVCLRDILRRPRRGYRWCGHRTSGDSCWCGRAFDHLKGGDW